MTEQLKALLIDPFNRDVYPIEIDPRNQLSFMYVNIGCTHVEAICTQDGQWNQRSHARITLYVDEEGAFVRHPGFTHPGLADVIRGTAIAVGPVNDDGEDTDITVTTQAMLAMIRWE